MRLAHRDCPGQGQSYQGIAQQARELKQALAEHPCSLDRYAALVHIAAARELDQAIECIEVLAELEAAGEVAA